MFIEIIISILKWYLYSIIKQLIFTYLVFPVEIFPFSPPLPSMLLLFVLEFFLLILKRGWPRDSTISCFSHESEMILLNINASISIFIWHWRRPCSNPEHGLKVSWLQLNGNLKYKIVKQFFVSGLSDRKYIVNVLILWAFVSDLFSYTSLLPLFCNTLILKGNRDRICELEVSFWSEIRVCLCSVFVCQTVFLPLLL